MDFLEIAMSEIGVTTVVMSIIIVLEVDSLSDIPTTLVGKVIPAHTYCVFNCKGGIAELGNVFRYAYDKWIPSSKYEVADCYDFELYDERFKGADNPETEIDIYIPINEK
jgi:AraC family transcriptional regulator